MLNEENTVMYQSPIGALQWNMFLGRPDIATTVRQRHLERLKHIHIPNKDMDMPDPEQQHTGDGD